MLPADVVGESPQLIEALPGVQDGNESTTPENWMPAAVLIVSKFADAVPTNMTSRIAVAIPVERRSKLNGLTIPRTPGAPWLDLTSSPAASVWTLAHLLKLRNWGYLWVFCF